MDMCHNIIVDTIDKFIMNDYLYVHNKSACTIFKISSNTKFLSLRCTYMYKVYFLVIKTEKSNL